MNQNRIAAACFDKPAGELVLTYVNGETRRVDLLKFGNVPLDTSIFIRCEVSADGLRVNFPDADGYFEESDAD